MAAFLCWYVQEKYSESVIKSRLVIYSIVCFVTFNIRKVGTEDSNKRHMLSKVL